jgi:F0F1-type ATP synthase assembly protein I
VKIRKVITLGNRSEQSTIREESTQQAKDTTDTSKIIQVLSLASQLGYSVVLPIAGGAFLGSILDTKFHTLPKMTLSFIFIGVIVAGAYMFTIIRATEKK